VNRRIVAVLSLAFALACGKHEETATPAAAATPEAAPRDVPERGNLLNIAYGASVISRTGELILDQSALRPIDGDPLSAWTSPPNDPVNHTIVYSLPARTRIEQVGVKTPRPDVFRITLLQFDSSIDGQTFTPLYTAKLAAVDNVQRFPVQPTDAQYVRVTVVEAAGRYSKLESIQVVGTPLEQPKRQPISGCWTINGFPAIFSEQSGRVTGSLATPNPVMFEGGAEGMVYRFVWIAGPDWGFGAMTTAPDGKHLSGLRWYIEPIEFAAAESWFGERTTCAGPPPAVNAGSVFLQRAKRLPLYGLNFDPSGALNETESAATLDMLTNAARQSSLRLALQSREYRQGGASANQRMAKTRLDSLRAVLQKRGVNLSRFDWRVLGSEKPIRAIETEIQRILYSVIELQQL
jgi:hypothetical protein